MNTFSHIGMAVRINKALQKALNIKLDTARFILGNIKPDVDPALIKIPHMKDGAFDFIMREIRELMALKQKEGGLCGKSFSERLGVVTHYISDFFCYAHSNDFGSGILRHIVYELRLGRFIKKNSASIKAYRNMSFLNRGPDYKRLCAFLGSLYKNYESKRPSFARDYIYSLRACTALTVAVVAACTPRGLTLPA